MGRKCFTIISLAEIKIAKLGGETEVRMERGVRGNCDSLRKDLWVVVAGDPNHRKDVCHSFPWVHFWERNKM